MTRTPSVPQWQRIARDLAQRITSGEIEVGDVVPSTDDLIVRYDASRGTVRRAVNHLQAVGVLRGATGKAVYVQRPPEEVDLVPLPKPPVEQQVADHERRLTELEQLPDQVGRLQAHLMSLYAQLNMRYPDVAQRRPKRRATGDGED